MSEPPAIDVEPLRKALSGDVVTPADPSWDVARQAWNLAADQHPALVVAAATADDVATTVRFAGEHGLRVAPQNTGHGAMSLGDLGGAILLRTSSLDDIAIDPAARTASVGAGARWRAVVAAAAEHGLVCLHGFSGGVGVAGYILGGGLGWLGRSEGLASGRVRSFDVVTAGGEQRHVDAGHDPDLFWALRGGGCCPAVVTAIEIELLPLREVFAGMLMWPLARAGEIVHAYREWIAGVPDSVTSTVRLMRYPPFPELPDPIRGKELVVITLAFTGSEAEGNELVAPLRAIEAPYLDTLATVPAAALGELAGDPPGPLPGIGDGLLLDVFTPEAADAFVELAGPGVQSPLIQLEIRHLGGALRTVAPDGGAAGAITAEALVYGVGVPVTPEVGTALDETIKAVHERLAPWTSSLGPLLTFAEQQTEARASFAPEVADRLARVAAGYDPDGRFVANHTIG